MRSPFEIGGQRIAPGTRQTVDLPLGVMSNQVPVAIPVHVVHGHGEGPTLFVSAAVHGDEVLGVEVIRRILKHAGLGRLHGTLLAVPIVNTFGFINHSRYLPDRHDLNRCFPGSPNGSLASQLAHLFMREVVARSQYGIDLHTGALHRSNLPQIRADFANPLTKPLVQVFGAPVVVHATLRDGSLRQAARERGVAVLLYEAGEALRMDELSIRVGVRGVLAMMATVGMLAAAPPHTRPPPLLAHSSQWERAPRGGVFRRLRKLGDWVAAGERLGVVADPFGEGEAQVLARAPGMLIGQSHLPVVNQGDALFHVAQLGDSDASPDLLDRLEQDLLPSEPD